MNKNFIEQQLVEDPVTHDFTLHSRVRDHTAWLWRCVGTAFGHFLLGSLNFHGHGSWLVCGVAPRLNVTGYELNNLTTLA